MTSLDSAKKIRLCFVVCVDPEIEKSQMFGIRYMPVWAYTLASYLRQLPGIELELYDDRLGESKIPLAEIYFYSALNQDLGANLRLLAKIRAASPSAVHALGGPITSSLEMANRLETLVDFDALFIGNGELEVVKFVSRLCQGLSEKPFIYKAAAKFELAESRPMDLPLLRETYHHYYGAVVEVSRGCPFLCEFCDIRTLPDNNRAHNKPVNVILEDLYQLHQLGVTNILFACDNFIGDPAWAERLCDEIISFKQRVGFKPKLYTWLTINISNHPGLIRKMKTAGFDMFFIGLESFGMNQLLETAKIQNTKMDLVGAIRGIQAYGIVVVAGLIFGFDSDTDSTVDETLTGILESGLISGDPTLLTALAGTPLYRRMELAGRLRSGKVALGGHKYSTNIRYLRRKEQIIADYIRFVGVFNSPRFQIKRLQTFLDSLTELAASEPQSGGYIDVRKILRLVTNNPRALSSAIKRLANFLASPMRIIATLYGLGLTLRHPRGQLAHYFFWVFNWSNSILKYGGISANDFDIESLDRPATRADILPQGYVEDFFEPIPRAKIKAQRQLTARSLERVIPK